MTTKPLYNLVRNTIIEIAGKCGLLELLPATNEVMVLKATEKLTACINSSNNAQHLKTCEDWAKTFVLPVSVTCYNILINHIQVRRCEISAQHQTCS